MKVRTARASEGKGFARSAWELERNSPIASVMDSVGQALDFETPRLGTGAQNSQPKDFIDSRDAMMWRLQAAATPSGEPDFTIISRQALLHIAMFSR